jgi:CheY-like chemotaxis protein
MKIPIDAVYIKLSQGVKDISSIFGRIFWSVSVVEIKKFDVSQKIGFDLIIIDCRGGVTNVQKAQELIERYPVNSLLIYDRSNRSKIDPFIKSGVKFFLPYPTNRDSLREYLQNLISVISLENRLEECENKLNYCREEVPKEKIGKESCLELQKHIQIVEGYIKKSCRESISLLENALSMNRLLIQTDLNDRDVAFLGSSLQSLNQLRNIFDDLEKFVVPEEKFSDGHKTAFNINAVLENISVVMLKYWREGDLSLIFNIENSVPAKILGNSMLLSKALVGVLEIVVGIKKRGEIILSISVVERGDRELLYFDPLKHSGLDSNQMKEVKRAIYRPQFLRIKSIVDMMSGTFDTKAGEIIGLGFTIPLIRIDRRNYRLPSREWMNKLVFIIAKNELIINALEGMLKYFHYDVDTSNNMQDAEKKLYHKTYDLIFLDEELFDSFEIYGYPLKRDAKVIVMAWPETQKSRISDYLAKTDTVIIQPFTQQKVFDTILELYSNDVLKEQRDSLNIMRDNLGFLLRGKRALYVGDNDSNWLMIKGVLKGSLIGMFRVNAINSVNTRIKSSDLIILSPKIYEDKSWRKWLLGCKNRCQGKTIIALIENLNPKLIKAIKRVGISQYLLTPINPENFYRILMEELMV